MVDPQIPTTELLGRRDRFIERLAQSGFDGAIITSPLNIHYLTGFDLGGFLTPQALIFYSDRDPLFVVREIEMTWQKDSTRESWCNNWASYTDGDDPFQVIADLSKGQFGGSTIHRLGLELNRPSMPYAVAQQIISAIGPDSVEPVTEVIEGLRRIKSPVEISHMREAGRIAKEGILAEAEAVKEGGSDVDAVSAAFRAMLSAGASLLADQPSLPVGPESARAHSHWSGRRPAEGELVTFFMAGSFGRYQCPVERTHALGAPPARISSILDAVLDVQAQTLQELKPGMRSEDVDARVAKLYESVGLEAYRFCRIGYSIGIAYPPGWWENEVAQLRPNDPMLLAPGMTFHIVPCLCVPGVGFVNKSMPVVITDDGCEPLIDLPLGEQLL